MGVPCKEVKRNNWRNIFLTLVERYLIIYLTASYTHSCISYIGWAVLKSVSHDFKYCNLFCHLSCSTEEVFEQHYPLTSAAETWSWNSAFSYCHKPYWQQPLVMTGLLQRAPAKTVLVSSNSEWINSHIIVTTILLLTFPALLRIKDYMSWSSHLKLSNSGCR